MRAPTTPDPIHCKRSSSDSSHIINRADVSGKPLLSNLYDVSTKISFMDEHNIDISVLSLGNPWLDFLPAEGAAEIASMNEEMQDLCSCHPGRLFFFATLPITSSISSILSEIQQLKQYPLCRGIVLGYNDFGSGLDAPEVLPMLRGIADAGFPIFFHPNNGLPGEVFGPCCADYGQVLPVSLGFTTETMIAITRIFLAGIFDSIPELRVILSHAGGTLPFIAGRIEACIENFPTSSAGGSSDPRKTIWQVLKSNIYLDGVVFDGIPLRAAADAVDIDRLMFGTDHPLFPRTRKDGMYATIGTNRDATEACFGKGVDCDKVMSGNAARILNLK
ncbi:hypothetical protein BCR34DRAFT_628933 [Clohesyomyces aquaticus]|uniref:Amidohydrolase-related domain-containing protein n=1 Tax=Clohesyomyces aquaticus TaxID=1231657 RepID=A0A1Y1YD14_9PLEO|nr:hypothetical protein BCR34DRAFT_628933 [Clohesyomyces aquaticus]